MFAAYADPIWHLQHISHFKAVHVHCPYKYLNDLCEIRTKSFNKGKGVSTVYFNSHHFALLEFENIMQERLLVHNLREHFDQELSPFLRYNDASILDLKCDCLKLTEVLFLDFS